MSYLLTPTSEPVEGDARIGLPAVDRCPVCNARQKPRDDAAAEVSCRRCGCDLSEVFAIVEQARGCFEYSLYCAAEGKISAAIIFIDKAIDLYRHDDFILWRAFLESFLPEVIS